MCPNDWKQFTLQTDASSRGVGAVLSQQDEHGQEHPVFTSYFQERSSSGEGMFGQCSFEAFCCIPDRQVPLCCHVRYLDQMRNSNPRLMRWALAAQPFNFSVHYCPGSQNGNADGLSWQAWMGRTQPTALQQEKGGRSVTSAVSYVPQGPCSG